MRAVVSPLEKQEKEGGREGGVSEIFSFTQLCTDSSFTFRA